MTDRQKRILEALEEFILEHGYSPTIHQLRKLVKIASLCQPPDSDKRTALR